MKKTIGRDLPGGMYIEITAALSDHFSVSALAWEQRGTWSGRTRAAHGSDCDLAGQVTDLIRSAAPGLEPLLLVHLADQNGEPMHGLANGWYFYTGAGREYELRHYGPEYAERWGSDHERAARALHVDPLDLPVGLDKAGFVAFARSLAPAWHRQADAARAVLKALVDGDGVEGR